MVTVASNLLSYLQGQMYVKGGSLAGAWEAVVNHNTTEIMSLINCDGIYYLLC